MSRPILAVMTAVLLVVGVAATTVGAAPTTTTARYYVTQDDCTGEASDNLRLATRLGAYSGNCAFLATPVNEVLAATGDPLADVWNQSDGATFVLDTSGEVTFEVAMTGPLTDDSLGLVTLDVILTASHGDFDSTTLVQDSVELQPLAMEQGQFTFTADIDDALAGVELHSLSASIVVRGVNDGSYVAVDGSTFVTFPHIPAV